MVDNQLISFIKNSLAQGYDLNSIRSHLLTSGFSSKEIEDGIQYVYSGGHEVKHLIELSKPTLILIGASALVIMLITVLAIVLIGGEDKPKMLLDLSLEPIDTSIEAGQTLSFITEVSNLGTSDRYDVLLRYVIVNKKTNSVAVSSEETIAVSTKATKTAKIKVPRTIDVGSYQLKATASYDEKEADASFSFTVYKKTTDTNQPTETDNEIENSKDEIVPSNEEKEEFIPGEISTEPTDEFVPLFEPSDSEDSPRLIIDNAETAAKTNMNEAGKICSSLEQVKNKDRCFSVVAKAANQSTFCTHIDTQQNRDSCFMNFAMQRDYSVCPDVENPYLKKACESLSYVNLANQENIPALPPEYQ